MTAPPPLLGKESPSHCTPTECAWHSSAALRVHLCAPWQSEGYTLGSRAAWKLADTPHTRLIFNGFQLVSQTSSWGRRKALLLYISIPMCSLLPSSTNRIHTTKMNLGWGRTSYSRHNRACVICVGWAEQADELENSRKTLGWGYLEESLGWVALPCCTSVLHPSLFQGAPC